MKEVNEKTYKALKTACTALDDKKGQELTVLDIRELTTMADYFVVVSGTSASNLRAMADEVEEKLYKQCGYRLNHSEGYGSANWILLDFSDIIIHIFNSESRDFYSIEHIWADAKHINADELIEN